MVTKGVLNSCSAAEGWQLKAEHDIQVPAASYAAAGELLLGHQAMTPTSSSWSVT
jgi:hypothetical protein